MFDSSGALAHSSRVSSEGEFIPTWIQGRDEFLVFLFQIAFSPNNVYVKEAYLRGHFFRLISVGNNQDHLAPFQFLFNKSLNVAY